jgi:hypothetical protein
MAFPARLPVPVRFSVMTALMVSMFLALSATALSAEWKIVKLSGDVRIHQESVRWVSLDPRRALHSGDTIWTGSNGRVMIQSDDGRVVVNPRSMVMIPNRRLPGNISVIFHGFGTVEATVEKRRNHHFSIQGKYMAAVVKGTRFTVSGDNDHTRLDVHEGLVQAVDIATGESADVPAGQSWVVSRAAGGGTSATSGKGGTTSGPAGPSGGSGSSGGGNGGGGGGNGNNGNGQGGGGGNGTGNEGNGGGGRR